MSELDLTLVRHALTAARRQKMATVELEFDGIGFSAILDPKKKKRSAQSTAVGAESDVFEVVKSSYVGYYGNPDPALIVGGKVIPGDIVGIVSILGIANEIETTLAGEIVEILVNDGQPVEYGQPLVRIKIT